MGNLLGNGKYIFEVDGKKIAVQELTIHDQQLFRVVFEDGRSPMNITRASTWAGKTWMSIPQGRQQEAEEIGLLIAEKLKKG